MKRLLARAADLVGVGPVGRFLARHKLPILMYHGVTERPLEPFCWHMLDVAAFRAQLEWVARRYTVLPLGDALERLVAGTLAPRSMAITFDDGYRNDADVAGPVLARLGLPATLYLVTDLIGGDAPPWPDRLYLAFARAQAPRIDLGALGLGTRDLETAEGKASAYAACVHALKARPAADKDALIAGFVAALDLHDPSDPGDFAMLRWDDVRRLAAGGLWQFGGHTTRHEILRHQQDADVAREVRASHERVLAETGRRPTSFAYPNGRKQDFDARAQAAVRAAGLTFAVSTVNGLASPASDPLALPRLCIGADLPLHRFRLLLAGL
jgi:peptidoglycan/xylan/chitin deacetylase (PgdA/CDA1 family)